MRADTPKGRRSRGIVVVGSLNVDLALACARLPAEGETLLAAAAAAQPGGKGGNQAVQIARLGTPVEMIGRVGDDVFGRQLVASLAADGVGTSLMEVVPRQPTGLAAVLLLPSGGNAIVVAPGANHAWDRRDLDAVEGAIAVASMLLLQLEIPMDVVQRAAEIARANGVPVLLNPAPAADLPDGLLGACDYLVPNRHEAEALTGVSIDGAEAVAAAPALLQRRGAENVVITLGPDGAIVAAAGAPTLLVPAPLVAAVDATAAGDSFCGALAVALCGGASLVEAATFACEVAAVSVSRPGSQGSLPRRDQIGVTVGSS